jgi:hypothetical protein
MSCPGTISQRIIAALAAAALIFPAAKHVINRPQKERILIMAELVNAQAALYTNGVVIPSFPEPFEYPSLYGYQFYAYDESDTNNSRYVMWHLPIFIPGIDTNDFSFYRFSKGNLELLKDAASYDMSWYGTPTLYGDQNGRTNFSVAPYYNRIGDLGSAVEVPTNLFDYTPYRLLSGGGPFTNDIYLGRRHGYSNTNTLNGGPFTAETREDWYTSDYGYDSVFLTISNGLAMPRVINGRIGHPVADCIPATPGYGDEANWSNRFVTLEYTIGRVYWTNISTEVSSSYEGPEDLEYAIDVLNGREPQTNLTVFVYTNDLNGIGIEYAGCGSASQGVTFSTHGGNYIEPGTNSSWNEDKPYPWRWRDMAFGCSPGIKSDKGYFWQDTIGAYNSIFCEWRFTNNVGDFVSYTNEEASVANTAFTLRVVDISHLRIEWDSFVLPAGECLEYDVYPFQCRHPGFYATDTNALTTRATAYWGQSLETYNYADTWILSTTNETMVLIDTLQQGDSENFEDPYTLLNGKYMLPKFQDNSATEWFSIGAGGWSVDHFGVTARLYQGE